MLECPKILHPSSANELLVLKKEKVNVKGCSIVVFPRFHPGRHQKRVSVFAHDEFDSI